MERPEKGIGRTVSAPVGLAGLLLLWELAPRLGLISSQVLPPPSSLPAAFMVELDSGRWLSALQMSLSQYLLGLGLGACLGVVLGMATALSSELESGLAWVVRLVRPMPGVAWLPLAVVWFGSGPQTATVVTAIAVLWVTWSAARRATRAVDPQLVEMATAYGLGGPWSRLLRIILPGAASGILDGVRTGAGLAWVAVIAAELVASPGLGQRMIQASSVPATDAVMVYLITIAALVATTDALLLLIREGLAAWQR